VGTSRRIPITTITVQASRTRIGSATIVARAITGALFIVAGTAAVRQTLLTAVACAATLPDEDEE